MIYSDLQGCRVKKMRHRGLVFELIGVLDFVREYHYKKSVELSFNYIKKKKKKKLCLDKSDGEAYLKELI